MCNCTTEMCNRATDMLTDIMLTDMLIVDQRDTGRRGTRAGEWGGALHVSIRNGLLLP